MMKLIFRRLYIFLVVLLLAEFNSALAQVISITRDVNQNYVIIYRTEDSDSLRRGKLVPGNLINPVVQARVSKDGLYKYTYEVENKETSRLGLYQFGINTSVSPEDISFKAFRWRARYVEWQSEVKWSFTNGRMYGMPPGKSEVFSYKSKGLPTIGKGYASNLTGTSFRNEDEELPIFLEKAIDSLHTVSGRVVLQTIVPRSLPQGINKSEFVDTLLSYVRRTCELGWIDNSGICRSLQAKLENVQRQLQWENEKAAADGLQAFLTELNALNEEQLSPEAYGLLYYNGKFLLEKFEG